MKCLGMYVTCTRDKINVFYIFTLYMLRPVKKDDKIHIKHCLWFSEHVHPVLLSFIVWKGNLTTFAGEIQILYLLPTSGGQRCLCAPVTNYLKGEGASVFKSLKAP